MIQLPVNEYHHFNFAESLQFLNRSPRECLHQVRDGAVYKLLAPEGAPVLLRIREDAARQSLSAEVLEGEVSPNGEAYISRFMDRWLHLSGSLQPFYDFAAPDPLLGPLVKEFSGLRLVGIPDLFECITWTITGQQINLAFAYTMKQRLVQAFGHTVEWEGGTYYLYPHPAVIAVLRPEDLMPMQFSRTKAEGIIRVAQLMADGRLHEDMLMRMTYEEARDALVSIKGIGPWSANYVLMKFAQHPQALPLEDAGLHNAIRYRMGLPAKPGIPEVKKYTDHWKNHAAYATFYCWRSLYAK
ncbi:DNA-3-methyladenine glycosylase 2 family protein [Chitinophaga lutea]|uniref:DNA-3-methyladenine glycosylase II n=1 Tax=Chitinophaga lutea TaxID=2488634 RepID=A0A3N4PJV1_9BACT|nr:DNA-3-methyladenine glycosylase [Chitinophaga lutea]RPE08963.1 DNA-3-methyladenine glycosylase 2 family protein [Chitinophaga lutea]